MLKNQLYRKGAGDNARFLKNKMTTRYSSSTKPFKSEQDILRDSNPMLTDSIQQTELVLRIELVDNTMGFSRLEHGENDGAKPRKGWLINMHGTTVPDAENPQQLFAAVDYYFLDEEGGTFKATMKFCPYFLLEITPECESIVEEWLKRFLEVCNVKSFSRAEKEDLAMPNHLVNPPKTLLKLTFHNTPDMLQARRLLTKIVVGNKQNKEAREVYQPMYNSMGFDEYSGSNRPHESVDPSLMILDIREYDLPYHVRVSIDAKVRVGKWYQVYARHGEITLVEDPTTLAFADPVILAFDIETTKAPLMFPDAKIDQIMMISYMIDGEGFLITNREIISEDIEDFEYTPKPEYPGLFTIFNEADEKQLLIRFFEHIRDARPTVIATYNGDFFDWPFVENRARFHDLDMFNEIGFAKDNEDEYKSKYCVHMDCFRWVQRDSYLPQGSQGLKAVTTAKLGYNPTELDPELMTPYAYEHPQLLSEYSVSDAVATYYLYYKYVHPFVFSLCTIIPLNPDEVLRKGTGTLCEMLLSVKAYENDILLPNKHKEANERFYEGHLLESETYVGGHVESLESGVFRSDLPTHFDIDVTAVDQIIGDLDKSIKFCVEVENNKKVEDVVNYQEVYEQIRLKLEALRLTPKRQEKPLIYHVDVASMYPNIMTSNRLQPDSMKTEEDCSRCDFNRPNKTCDRRLKWSWRGEHYTGDQKDYNTVKRQLQDEMHPPIYKGKPDRLFSELTYDEQAQKIKQRMADYCKKNYTRPKKSALVDRETIICQRENPFYVDTVRDFRDRRYEFKGLAKVWKGKSSKVSKGDVAGKDEAEKMVVLYDSLQLAHKVILNSFYGYVMRKGSRWYSMEMAGVTCLTGSIIIQMARTLVERLGRPLELDTDGIWCILPESFPENYKLKTKDGKTILLEYPCSMLNFLVHQQFTNHQYQDLVDPETFKYDTRSENSIFFEVDGPYKAMILPTSLEENKGLKKRYAVFNHDGSLAELKGFELKRRGELRLIQNFQSDIFKLFLEGNTLEGCYGAVALVANNWLDVLDTKGGMLEDEDLIELICENKRMSKSLADYAGQKSTSITTAKRLGEFLGEEMVKGSGIATKYIVSALPLDAPVTERAIPVSIFSSDKKEFFLRKWLKDPSLTSFGPREILDWEYYRERLSSVIQKIITIPAALQNVANPVPRVPHPDWLKARIDVQNDSKKQTSIGAFFGLGTSGKQKQIQDLEDFRKIASDIPKARVARVTSKRKNGHASNFDIELEEADKRILDGICPAMTEDYGGFLEYQKAKWRLQAANRENRARLFGPNAESSQRSSIGGMVRKHALNIAGSKWEILQYKLDPRVKGDMIVFAMINNRVHTLRFHVPKQVYAAFKLPLTRHKFTDGCVVQESNAMLPNGHDASNLYKLIMSEPKFEQELSNLDGLLQDPSLIGLYESNINAVERAIITLGNTVLFDDTQVGALGRGLNEGFDIKDMRPASKPDYLKRFNMDIIYLLHLVTNSYEFYAVFNTKERCAQLFILKPSPSAQELPGSIENLFAEMFESKKSKLDKYYSIIDYSPEMTFETNYFNDANKLLKKLNQKIAIHNEKSNKAMLAVQSPYSSRILGILESASIMPTIEMNVRELTLPAVGWQSLISKRIINHYFSLAGWAHNLISLSSYGGIPLCNLRAENVGYMIDVEYARRLSAANIVLWWSKDPLPDHAGFELNKAFDFENLEFRNINNPEIYESACLEIEIGTLTINTILTSSLINECEGADMADDALKADSNNGASTVAQDSFSSPALSILRTMVKTWWDDAVNDNANADSMMNNLVTWVQRKSSHLYDVAMHYHVHNLTTKALLQLLGEFRRMGAHVVFANRNKAIVKTSKITVENSYAFGQYMARAVRSKPLFNFLDLRVSKYWDILVWMDEFNYSGRFCEEITQEESQDLSVESKWHIRDFLPQIYREEFDDWVIIFLDLIAKQKREQLLGTGLSGTPRKTQITHLLNGKKNEQLGEVPDDEVFGGVTEAFRSALVKRIKKLYKRQNEAILNPEFKQEYEFPRLAGSHLHLKNPTLELTKFLCAILALSQKRNIEVRVLRKELLGVFDVKEFSREAEFANPSTSLKVPHLVCDYCNYISDIDLCRDSRQDIERCCSCHRARNIIKVEEDLISLFNRLVTKFYAQDYKCGKCGQIRDSNLRKFCKCSGTWVETISHTMVSNRWHVYENVANIFKFQLLSELLESS